MAFQSLRRLELRLLVISMTLLAAAAAWLLSTRPGHKIEGDFLEREQAGDPDNWLLAQAANNPVAEERARACLALGRIGGEIARSRLIAATRDVAPSVRAMAAFGLGLAQDVGYGNEATEDAAEALIEALSDEERSVVAYAVEALGKMLWRPAVVQMTQTPAPLVFTLTAIARIDDERLLPFVRSCLRSNDQDVRWGGAVALNRMGAPCDEELRRSLIALATRDRNNFVRAQTTEALGRCEPSEEAAGALGQALTYPDPKVRGQAALTIGEWGEREYAALLEPALQDDNVLVRRQALLALLGIAPDLAEEVAAQLDALGLTGSLAITAPPSPAPLLGPLEPIPDLEPPELQEIARTQGRRLVLETSEGELPIELDYENAPMAAERFYRLAMSGAFELQNFARVRPNGYVQAPARDFAAFSMTAQRNPQPFLRGSIGWAAIDGRNDSPELFIAVAPLPFVDGRYTNFGRLLAGDDILDRITESTQILSIRAGP